MDYKELLDRLTKLYINYAKTFRSSLQPIKIKQHGTFAINVNDEAIRESLIEHVGLIPIVATELYPFINDTEVNLGESLIMLSIHDIGETSVGDTNFYIKTNSQEEEELKHALNLLNPQFHKYMMEFETQSTKNAKYAMSIDKLVPSILEILIDPKVTIDRFKTQSNVESNEIINLIRNKKKKYFEWNEFLKNFSNFIFDKLEILINKKTEW